ncbi:MAG: DUF1800 domain-containing protein [Acidobacteriia bacterium]|nr:DUF1800 domain-containing protein [Terriglobia bacterium]
MKPRVLLFGLFPAYLGFASLGYAQGSAPAISDRAAERLLDQAAWGPTPADIHHLQQIGISGWLDEQFQAPPSYLPDQPILNSAGKTNTDFTPLQRAFFQNVVSGPDQLRQRVAFALSEMWVVSGITVNAAYAWAPYYHVLVDNAFGNYRDLIKAVTLSPAMGTYLNMANNNKANPAKGTAANENYARELMQLFTVGLVQLNPDGSPVLDQNGNPVPTYSQAMVTATARALTGWTYPTAPDATAKANNSAYYIGQMIPVETEHDMSSKVIIGNVTLPPNQTAEQDLDGVLDTLMAQPTIAPFVSRQLIQHLVTSNPSPAYIQRVSSVFSNNGSGITGDMKSVITAILTDPEARAADDPSSVPNANFGHLREPVLFIADLLRALNANVTDTSVIYSFTAALGQTLFYPPTVFSYFSPLYQLSNGTPAPEFQIYSTATAATRANIINAAIYGTLDKNTPLDYSEFMPYANDNLSLFDHIAYVFLHHSMSPEITQAVATSVNATTSAQGRVQAALYIVLTSAEYQVVQ